MTVEWYDLGQRVHAATTGKVAARLVHAPIPAPRYPVAVRAHATPAGVHVTVATREHPEQSAVGADALTMLHEHGVQITPNHWRTLVTDDTATLPALAVLARSAARDGAQASAAAHIAWWLDRADFPATTAVVDTLATCRARWVTGTPPAAETSASTWRRWLGIPSDATTAILDVLDLVTAGPPLPGLHRVASDDAWWWQRACEDHADGRDWRRPDSTARAALGLRARCDAADEYAACLLHDPAYRRRAVHSGHVITGILAAHPPPARRIHVICDRLDARVRVGSDVSGWEGVPSGDGAPFSGSVISATVTDGRLVLELSISSARPGPGSRVTLHASAPNPAAVGHAKRAFSALYARRGSWLTTGQPPVPQRRDVPLDVLVAAAEQESHA